MQTVAKLDGTWDFLLDKEDRYEIDTLPRQVEWSSMPVPGAWEAHGISKSYTGAVWYRRSFSVDQVVKAARYWLEFDGVSYYCQIWVNGQYAGSHRGSWDAFRVEVTSLIRAGENSLVVRVEKPGGRFPLKESLAGFLPYVQGAMFGGIWQSVRLIQTGRACLDHVYIKPDVSRERALVEATFNVRGDTPAHLQWEITDPGGRVVAGGWYNVSHSEKVKWNVDIPDAMLWSPQNPTLYSLSLRAAEGPVATEQVTRFGMREVAVDGARILLNGEFIYPRGVLHWGWYPDLFCPRPSRQLIRQELQQMKKLGYNMIKHCLYVPIKDYFELADELGFLTWLELPLWMPEVKGDFAARVQREYGRILRQVRNYPSLLLYTLGCELDKTVPADLLKELYELTKQLTESPLVRDNSGSAECYGGVNVEFADFYDHHFYSEPHLYRSVLDVFTPRARGAKPWLFGEFLDCDTYRDLDEIVEDNGGELPWWMQKDEDQNPQGVRWEYSIVEHLNRITQAGLRPHTRALVEGSKKQAALMRKLVLETVRSYEEISGYVILGVKDTPIATPGMYDDLGRLKFTPDDLYPVNRDSVLVLGWDRRRQWKNGGDRPYFLDVYNYQAGGRVRPHLCISFGEREAADRAAVSWRVELGDGSEIAGGNFAYFSRIEPGAVVELGVLEFTAPEVSVPHKMVLRAKVTLSDETQVTNSWHLWVYPKGDGLNLAGCRLYDPGWHLRYLEDVYSELERVAPDGTLEGSGCVIASCLTPAVCRFVRNGGKALIVIGHDEGLLTEGVPFWRESLKLFADHPVWRAVRHEGFADTQFFGLATDRALNPEKLQSLLRDGQERIILRRVDGRHLTVLDYLVEYTVGSGRLLATTLSLGGGMGNQPSAHAENVAGQQLLGAMINYLLDNNG